MFACLYVLVLLEILALCQAALYDVRHDRFARQHRKGAGQDREDIVRPIQLSVPRDARRKGERQLLQFTPALHRDGNGHTDRGQLTREARLGLLERLLTDGQRDRGIKPGRGVDTHRTADPGRGGEEVRITTNGDIIIHGIVV